LLHLALDNDTGYRGVRYAPDKASKGLPYAAKIRVGKGGTRKRVWLGPFATAVEAAAAYSKYADSLGRVSNRSTVQE